MHCVSVIVPVYKVEPWLRQSVDSILAQTLQQLELILVDDGSPDGCGAICDEYAQKDRRVQVIHKPNGGLISAWTAGLGAASAPWVGFVDSDDWVDPGYFEQLYTAALQTGADVVMAEHIEHTPDGERCFSRSRQEIFAAPDGGRRFLARYYSAVSDPGRPLAGINARWTKLYRRQLLLDNLAYFPPEVWHGEDMMANAAVLADCRCVVQLSGGARYHYMIRDDSLSSAAATVPFTDRWAANELAFLRTMAQILRDKALPAPCYRSILGQTAYSVVINQLVRRDISYADKRRCARQVLASTPPGALAAYARTRKNPFVTVYCALLQAHLFAPCILLCVLFSRLTGGRHDA